MDVQAAGQKVQEVRDAVLPQVSVNAERTVWAKHKDQAINVSYYTIMAAIAVFGIVALSHGAKIRREAKLLRESLSTANMLVISGLILTVVPIALGIQRGCAQRAGQ
jgi:hypothetical protein